MRSLPSHVWSFCHLVILSSCLCLFAQADEPGDLSRLRGITGIEEVPAAPLAPRWPYWLALSLVISTGLVVAGWKVARRRGRAAAPPLPPDLWALAELDRLEAMKLPEAGAVERFHTLLSDVVRSYLERRFDMRAPRQTTIEFLETMRQSPQLTATQQELLRAFLSRCDLAKFARAMPSAEECGATAAMARRFVEQTRHQLNASV